MMARALAFIIKSLLKDSQNVKLKGMSYLAVPFFYFL